MSDWKSRAKPVSSGSWKERASVIPQAEGIDPTTNMGFWGSPEVTQAMDLVGKGAEAVSDGVMYGASKVPVLGALMNSGAAGITSLIDPSTSYDSNMRNIQGMEKEMEERSPIATTVGGVGGNVLAGAAMPAMGLGATLAANAGLSTADMVSRDLLLGQENKNFGRDLAIEAGMGAFGHGAGKLLKGMSNADVLRGKAVDNVKTMFNPTVKEQQAFGIKGDDLDNAARRFLDDGGLDTPFVSKNTLYEKAAKGAQDKFQQFDDVLNTKARAPTQQELFEELSRRRGGAADSLNPELAAQLGREAKAVRGMSSNPVPLAGNTEEIKDAGMAVTDVDPNLIRQRRSALDADSRDMFGGVSDRAKAEAAHTYRNFEEGLLDPQSRELYKGLKGQYGDAALARDLLSKQAARAESQTLMGAVDRNFGAVQGGNIGQAVAGTPGRVVGATLGGGAFAAVKSYGPQFKAWGYNLGAKVAENNRWMQTLSKAGERGGQTGVASAHYLMMQRDPEYRQAYSSDKESEK